MSTVLVLAAHPDDELLGVGGTLARHVRSGDAVHAVVLAEGASSRYRSGLAEDLAKSAQRAAEVLRLSSLELWDLPDQRLDTLPLIDVVQRMEAVVNGMRPDLVYTHFPCDVNADHGVVARAAWTACRPYVLPRLRRFAVFETPSSTEWAWAAGSPFTPSLYVDVSDTLDTKLEAMACYKTELRPPPHPRSLGALRERAAYWGSQVGRQAVEPFQILREVC
ncbi:LmbE family N-acetylglucosaminyl deacetylase [Streptomyces sp. TLI_55]|uniref:PIG-L deacetylase family protein n=1 Tax=Streptomyces sp. TLI_55 TaxID=1938861 RepID=UPI000BDD8BB9|nr:PIG-L deacetylase family protein [Streptomyces sp. TLI_55]SNX65348.1 LmbE family N-acetylglucosaminyl deacetylase [Streptomyces sp. TLI_55]